MPSASWQELEHRLDEFEQAWQQGRPVSLRAFVSKHVNGSPEWNERLLRELVLIDMEQRWRSGQPSPNESLPGQPRLEDYLRLFPELAGQAELLAEEYRIRSRWGTRPAAEEYAQRSGQPAAEWQARFAAIDAEQAGEAPAAPALPAASQRYQVANEIARGGMGAVYKAVDHDLRREVAVKFLLDQGNADKTVRFIEEAQITGQLDHPNIVPIHELSVDKERGLFFAMKMVKGRSLQQVLEQLEQDPKQAARAWPLPRLLNVFISVCNALAYAHARGVLHRDLKPANVMIGDFGEVYVMDWGLAKLLAAPATEASAAPSPAAEPVPLSGSRADLTHDGSVLGTPVYMAPEQAAGQLDEIDRQSDVYSLGAILYQILTLQPPVDPTGTYLEVLERVCAGAIVPPEARAPRRKIARDLAAVAGKALALRKADRYASADDLRRDVERYLEGRSVSAKRSTLLEGVWKLVKRNRGVSAVSALAAVLVLVLWGRSLWFDYLARQEKREQGRRSVPAFVRAAQFSARHQQFDDALAQVDVALEHDPDNATALLLRGKLLIVLRRFEEARGPLAAYLRQEPADADAARLSELCHNAPDGDARRLAAFAEVFLRRQEVAFAEALDVSIDQLIGHYRKQIEAAWPGLGPRLKKDARGCCTLDLSACRQVADLAPLKDMPLTELSLQGCADIVDLGPLRGMPLGKLNLEGCRQLRDIGPLRGLPLGWLELTACPVKDLSPLSGMPLRHLNLSYGPVQDLAPLRGLPLGWLNLYNCPGVTELAPLRGLPLTSLNLQGCQAIKDIGPLQGMPLANLNLNELRLLHDLTPLRGLPLTQLSLSGCVQVTDLAPLRGMPLSNLTLASCNRLEDLTPIANLPLYSLDLRGCDRVSDLAPLRGLPIASLSLTRCRAIHDLTPLKGTKILWLHMADCPRIHDVTPLASINLETLTLSPQFITTGLESLRTIKSLRSIIDGAGRSQPAAEFWQRFDRGEFRPAQP